jgi:Flp pilus assembly protein TadD
MRVDQFWKSWTPEYRRVWYLVSGTLLAFIAFVWIHRYDGADGVIDWVTLQEQKVIESVIHTFSLGPFKLTVPAESYVIFEYLHGGSITPNVVASYIFLFSLIFGAILIIGVISTLSRFWYLIGLAFFVMFLASLRFEVLGIFGFFSRFVDGIVIGLFALVSFYFNRIRPTVGLPGRLLVFSVMWIVLGLVIALGAHVQYPFYHLTLTGYAAGMVLSIVFIVIISHEILAGFIYITSQNKSHNLRHFGLIAAVYMANLILTCMHEIGAITWNFIYLDVYLLLTLSAILGLWGFRRRELQYENIFPFAPSGALGYVALAAICFGTTGQLLANWNDPALRVIRDAIVFSQTGYGIIFLVYIFSNFIYLLARNLPVDKVLYNPTRMPYFTYRFAGLIAMLGFVFYSGWREYVYHGVSGFYNTTGDLYGMIGNELYAESFYQQGTIAFQNNRSNYALAKLSAGRMSFETAHEQYERANGRRPTPYSLVNDGNIYVWEGNNDAAIKAYREGYARLKGSSIIANNLGFVYAKKNNLDSALYFLNMARQRARTKTSAETNFLALAALEEIPLKTDSVLDLFKSTEPAVLANAIALSTVTHQPLTDKISPMTNRQLTLHTATLLNNYAIRYMKTIDTTFVEQAYRLASDSLNNSFSEALKSSLAYGYYYQGNVAKALEILAELVYVSQSYQGKFNYTMGLWALEQGNPDLASRYFTFADTYDYKEAKFYNAIALSESGLVDQARSAWDSVALSQKGNMLAIALQMKKILALPSAAAQQLNDTERYQYCRYRLGLADSLEMNRLLVKFESNDYKAMALLDYSKKYYEAGETVPAIRYFRQIGGLKLVSKELYNQIQHFELLMLARQKDLRGLANQINAGIKFDNSTQLQKILYTALISESSGDTVVARKNYEVLAAWNPYLEDGIIAAADYFRKHDRNKLRAYAILAEAIQINTSSIPLYIAYIREATRVGFDEYAADATERLVELQKRKW